MIWEQESELELRLSTICLSLTQTTGAPREGAEGRDGRGGGWSTSSARLILLGFTMAQLAIKVFTMTVKTASKPLAYLFQDYMLSHPGVRQNAIDAAQVLHRWNVRLNRANRGQEKKTEISPLNDERALNLAGKVSVMWAFFRLRRRRAG